MSIGQFGSERLGTSITQLLHSDMEQMRGGGSDVCFLRAAFLVFMAVAAELLALARPLSIASQHVVVIS
jgi:hypothetical protein